MKLQYSSGIYKISSWADITNCHSVPGEGIISGLKEIGLPLDRGLLLLAEMSSKGALAKGSYATETFEMATRHTDFCIGFIGQHRIESDVDFLYLTPGVNLSSTGDSLGQQYRTPRQVIYDSKCDVIIVGRGIYGGMEKDVMVSRAIEYRDAGWRAYLDRLEN